MTEHQTLLRAALKKLLIYFITSFDDPETELRLILNEILASYNATGTKTQGRQNLN